MKKVSIAVLVLMIGICLFPLLTHAAPPDPDCDPLDPACPIDGGLTLLIAAGMGLGFKKAIGKSQEH